MTGIQDAYARFRSDLAAATTRASRASGEGGARNAALRAATRELADRARAGKPDPASTGTSPDVRRVAGGWREGRGLPVENLPSEMPGAAGESQAQTEANANRVHEQTRPASRPATARGARPAVEQGDDEDFSQARIMS
ncbi:MULTISPECIES: hypothetical protein [Actinosynnema]|uniref:hypothetical protein n=1 Tax=Actinosynnema TaxID=40566 RepID=UPI0020A375F9|nr:hypothetical protein [Actinosynnema pretiosum]MCP2095291.1 hypothetical protein [Actinosynnema pretiosum]